MAYRDIVKQAWDFTHQHKQELFSFGFIPSFFAMIVGVIYIAYQIVAFSHSPLFSRNSEGLDYIGLVRPVWDFMQNFPSIATLLVIISFFILLMYFFSPIVCNGALIDLITKGHVDKPLRGGFAKGVQMFFPLFEFSAMTSVFSVTSYLTELSMVIRNFGTGTWVVIIPVLTAILIVGMFLSLLFVFVPQLVVLEGDNVIQAMKRSALLVLRNVRDAFFLGVTMALITLRLVINIALILLVPLLFMSIVALMAGFAMKWVGIVLGAIIGFAMIVVGAYVLAGFHIFIYAVWTLSFLHFRKQEVEESL